MQEVASRRPGRPARLSRDAVLRAAMAVADEGGLDALTMGRIGEQVGAEAMSLYRHVRNKDDLLDGIVDLVFAEIELPATDHDWKAAMRERAISARAALSRHPWAIGLMESRSRPGSANMGHHDAVLGILFAAGFSGLDATHAYNLLDSYIYGFALQERGMPFGDQAELADLGASMFQDMPAGEYANLQRVAGDLIASGFDYADEFEFGLDLILDGLERRLGARR
ncbi:MAG TPA: TetR/AcrR family transcriptional regulator [Candidatus Limnocylindrales bacterium]|nr:TetR/AcrR family transcriptional regulator [Candidatus Limnocylindrales bacterium]